MAGTAIQADCFGLIVQAHRSLGLSLRSLRMPNGVGIQAALIESDTFDEALGDIIKQISGIPGGTRGQAGRTSRLCVMDVPVPEAAGGWPRSTSECPSSSVLPHSVSSDRMRRWRFASCTGCPDENRCRCRCGRGRPVSSPLERTLSCEKLLGCSEYVVSIRKVWSRAG